MMTDEKPPEVAADAIQPNGKVVELEMSTLVGERIRLQALLKLQSKILGALSTGADPRALLALTAQAVMTLIAIERDRANEPN